MIRVGVYSRSEEFHRALSHASSQSAVLIQLRLRSERGLVNAYELDVLVVDAATVAITPELAILTGSLPIVVVGTSSRSPGQWRERAEGWAELSDDDPFRVLAAARAAAFGLRVREHDPRSRLPAVDSGGSALAARNGDPDPPEDRAQTDAAASLTPREREVLDLLAHGRTNAEIAGELGVSANTVKYHLSGLFSKLDATTRSEAVWKAITLGMIAL